MHGHELDVRGRAPVLVLELRIFYERDVCVDLIAQQLESVFVTPVLGRRYDEDDLTFRALCDDVYAVRFG